MDQRKERARELPAEASFNFQAIAKGTQSFLSVMFGPQASEQIRHAAYSAPAEKEVARNAVAPAYVLKLLVHQRNEGSSARGGQRGAALIASSEHPDLLLCCPGARRRHRPRI
jgi:hypothetical protein